MKQIIEENFPSEFIGLRIDEIDLIPWLNDKLKEGKIFCGLMPLSNGMIRGAIFLKEDN